MSTSANTSTSQAATVAPDSVIAGPVQDDLISREARQLVETVCYGLLTTVECLIGIPANVINCLVFWRQGLKDRMNLCLFSLSLVDCCYLGLTFVMFPMTSLIEKFDQTFSAEYYTMVFVHFGNVLFGLRSTSGCVGMVIAVDRCVCVAFPLRSSTLIKTRTMGGMLVACFLVLQGFHLIYRFMFTATTTTTAAGVVWQFAGTQFYFDNRQLADTLAFTVLGAAFPLFTFVVVSCATVITVVKLRAAMTWRSKASSETSEGHSQQAALSAMLVVLSLVYIVTMAPFVARQVAFLFVGGCSTSGRCVEFYAAVTAIAFTVQHINNVIHIIIYYSRSSKYRHEFRKLLGCATRQPAACSTSTSAHFKSQLET